MNGPMKLYLAGGVLAGAGLALGGLALTLLAIGAGGCAVAALVWSLVMGMTKARALFDEEDERLKESGPDGDR